MTDPDLIEQIARAIYDALEGPVNNQDFSRQLRQWEQSKALAAAALSVVLDGDRGGACEGGL